MEQECILVIGIYGREELSKFILGMVFWNMLCVVQLKDPK